MKVPTLTTERLELRAVREDDVPSYARHFVDYEVIRYLAGAVPWPYPEYGVHDYVVREILPNQGNNRWVWGIFMLNDPGELIGVVDLWRPGSPANRGFWLGRKFWGKGFMTEALIPITDYAFDCLGFDSLTLDNAKGNIRSRRIKERSGAKLLRVERAKFVDPKFTEREIWMLTRADWKKRNSILK